MRFRKIGSGLLAIIIAVALAAPTYVYGASRFSDTAGHWAETYINTAVSKGIITGYPDKTFLPDKAVTRAEFATMINKALNNKNSVSLGFGDVPYSEWYYEAVSKAVAAAYAGGYDDNTFKPNNPISRQEAAVMISRIVPTYRESGNLKAYSDYRSIADWAYDAMAKMNGKGYIGAYSDGKIHPADPLTRAQTAKIICDILDNESIVTSSPVIDDDGTKLSGKIYTNNVTIDEDLGDDSATIDNCVILGNLNVKGGGENTITISNSRVSSVTVDKDDSPVRILAKGETAIAKLSASESSILQTSSLAGGLYGPGFSNIIVNGSAEVTLKGSFPLINVNGSKANVTLDDGTITKLIVASAGKYSNITAASRTTISEATVNAESYFHGEGTISHMTVNADDVTYETKPKKWTIASRVDTPKEADAVLAVTFSPKHKATDVKLDTKLTITFSSAMKMYDGDSISNSDIDDFITVRKGSSSGSKVGFSASINSAKKVITITPSSDLEKNTRYYVNLEEDALKDSNSNGNDEQNIYFTTGSDTLVLTTTYSPANGATAVSVNPSITITFSEGVVKYSGSSISSSDSYLKECIIFKKTSSSGSDVAYSASINSAKKTITITPKTSLDSNNQKYYLAIRSSKLKTSSGTAVPSSSVTWTTGIVTPVLSGFKLTPGDTSISATMTPNVAGKVYAVVLPSGSAAPTSSQIAAGQNNSGGLALASAKNESVSAGNAVTLPTLNGLGSGITYDVWATLYSTASGTYSAPVKVSTTTTLPRIQLTNLTVKPIIGSTTENDEINFNSSTYGYSVSLNDDITNVKIAASGNSEATITINGSGIGTVTGVGSKEIDVPISANPTITVTISMAGKTSSTYTVSLSHNNDTSLKTLKIGGASQSISGLNYYFELPTTSALSISLDIVTKDKFARINTPVGTGISVETKDNLPGSASFTLKFGEGSQSLVLDFSVISGSDSDAYTITFKRPSLPDTPDTPDTPGTPDTGE